MCDYLQMRNLVVYSLPTMKLLYSLEVANVSALVQTDVGQVREAQEYISSAI